MATKDTAAKTDTDSKTEENITDDKTEAADTSKKKKAALAKAKQVLKIGFVSFSEEDQRHKDLKLGMEKRMQDEGYEAEMIVRETPMYANAQLEAIDEVVKAGIKGLLLTPYNDKRIVEKIDELEAKGIPVVTVCSDIEGTKRTAYVGSDNKRLGQTVGALL